MPRQTAKVSRENRRAEVERRYLRGESQVTIAQALGCSAAQASRDLATMRGRWTASVGRSHQEVKSEALARLDEMLRCHWEGWEASLLPRETTLSEKRSGPGEPTRVTLRREARGGDPRFLVGIARIEERRSKLLGLDAPDRCEVSAQFEEPMDPEKAKRELWRLMGSPCPWELTDHVGDFDKWPPGFDPPDPGPSAFERLFGFAYSDQ